MATLRCKHCGDVFTGEPNDHQGYDFCRAHKDKQPIVDETTHDADDKAHETK